MPHDIIGDIIGIIITFFLIILEYSSNPPRPPKTRKPNEPIQPTFLG